MTPQKTTSARRIAVIGATLCGLLVLAALYLGFFRGQWLVAGPLLAAAGGCALTTVLAPLAASKAGSTGERRG